MPYCKNIFVRPSDSVAYIVLDDCFWLCDLLDCDDRLVLESAFLSL